jgi:heme/copper-type cytochrome/quinol oxidase subunit 2
MKTGRIFMSKSSREEKNSAQRKEARRKARQRQKKIRMVIFGVLVVGVLGLAGNFLKQAFFRPPPPPMAGNVIDLTADMAGFSQKEIRVKAGQAVTVRLESLDNSHHTDGGGKHQWAVDELGVDIIAQPLSTNYATFTPDKPGEYTFYCDICCGGRANPTMNGKLIVEA